MTSKSPIIRLLLTMSLMLTSVAHAIEYQGLDFPDRVRLQGSMTELQLNGIGTRTKFFFDIYIGALYTVEKSSSAQIIAEMRGPKRIQMHFLHDEVKREKLVEGWNEGFANNNDQATLAKLAERIKQFNSYFPTMRAGDEVKIDYVPRKGTRIIIKGTEVGVIKGDDFFPALLKIWLGDEPADDDLKDGMLGL